MLQRLLTLLLLVTIGTGTYAGVLLKFPFAGSTVELLDSTDAAIANSKSDVYSRSLTPFDLQIRLGIQNASEKDYLAKAATQTRNWSPEEQQILKQSFGEIEAFLKTNKVILKLPATIKLIKTAGKEEFEAEGYTRENRITLCPNRQKIDVHLVAHELFHVYSRYNETKRNEIYKIFGFKKCNKINTAAAMQGRVITNPDCPVIEHYIRVKVQEQPKDLVLQLYSTRDYKPEYNLGDYMNVGLLEVAGTDLSKKPVMKDGKGILYQIDEVPELFQQISSNTPYIIHPEEISAEHFSMWIVGQKVPQPEYFARLKEALIKK